MKDNKQEALDHFGKFIAENLRDRAMKHYDLMAQGHWKSPSILIVQERIVNLSQEQKDIMRRCLLSSVDSAIHDFLFKLQKQADFENRIEILVDGENIVECSDGIHGEMFLEDGWFARFSKDGEPPDKY